jgi:hypothetical protein
VNALGGGGLISGLEHTARVAREALGRRRRQGLSRQ